MLFVGREGWGRVRLTVSLGQVQGLRRQGLAAMKRSRAPDERAFYSFCYTLKSRTRPLVWQSGSAVAFRAWHHQLPRINETPCFCVPIPSAQLPT